MDKKRDSVLSQARRFSTSSKINADIMMVHTKYPKPRVMKKLKTQGSEVNKRVFKIYNVPPENISMNKILKV